MFISISRIPVNRLQSQNTQCKVLDGLELFLHCPKEEKHEVCTYRNYS